MKYHILASGSKGNATLIQINNEYVLIDCGVTLKYLKTCLVALDIEMEAIALTLLTHDHSDHKKNIRTFEKHNLYADVECYDGKCQPMEAFVPIQFNDAIIMPIPLSHDATKTYGFIFEHNKEKLVYITDTGYINEQLLPYIQNAQQYIIESNHDTKMLMDSQRPYFLKQRILSDTGHLSNEECGIVLAKVVGENTRSITLAHLSEEANTEGKALTTVSDILQQKSQYPVIKIKVAKQYSIVSSHHD